MYKIMYTRIAHTYKTELRYMYEVYAHVCAYAITLLSRECIYTRYSRPVIIKRKSVWRLTVDQPLRLPQYSEVRNWAAVHHGYKAVCSTGLYALYIQDCRYVHII